MASSLDLLDCSICLQMLDEPVTTACGHSFCKKCINTFWDTGPNLKKKYTCPQCRTTFSPKPALQRNTVLTTFKKTTTGRWSGTVASLRWLCHIKAYKEKGRVKTAASDTTSCLGKSSVLLLVALFGTTVFIKV
uniref:RING-type domain-containing protein n=1 Tax=Xiphophorus couchianus TaxID=32473 RepID=A0A3B5KRK9_9TELE